MQKKNEVGQIKKMISLWAREDSNLHGLLHTLLKRARLPITPRAQYRKNNTTLTITLSDYSAK